MANKKLKNFEFAYHSEKGNAKQANTDEMLFFECENGSVFLICQDNAEHDLEKSPASLATQRIKYYLENEFVQNPDEALFNALVYTNGFIFEYGRKNSDYSDAYVHCACILVRNNQVYYSVIGDLALYFFNGRRVYHLNTLSTDELDSLQKEKSAMSAKAESSLLGQSKHIQPLVNREALIPLNDDMLLMCSHGFYAKTNERSVQKILSDPMPVQTKMYRLLDMANIADGEENISLHLISFYNLDHTERKFVPIDQKRAKAIKIKSEGFGGKKTIDDPNTDDKSGKSDVLSGYIANPIVRRVLLVIATLILAYMFFDIFIRDPMPPVRLENTQTEETVVGDNEEAESQMQQPVDAPHVTIPADTVYTVRNGDTWGRIYSRFGVCSWFIRNHQPNSGKFDSEENPVAGTSIHIPLLYSSRSELNPDFYQEFGTEKTGSRCENAGQEFLDEFRRDNL